MTAESRRRESAQKAERLVALFTPARAQEIGELEDYAAGTQYDGLPNFFNDSVPIQKRGPHMVEPVVRNAIRSYADFLTGEGRWPEITSRPEEDDSIFDPVMGLDEDDSAKLDALVDSIEEQVDFRGTTAEAVESAQAARSACGVLGARDGALTIDLLPVKWCRPTLDRDGRCVRLELQYPFTREVETNRGLELEAMLYRRVIDAVSDTVYLPASIDDASRSGVPSWTVDPGSTIEHGLGFCPVVWWPYMKTALQPPGAVDGHAIHEHILGELDTVHRTASQLDRSGYYCGDPQLYETGVAKDHNPSDTGDKSSGPLEHVVDGKRVTDTANKAWIVSRPSGGPVRRKGPGIVWRYPDPLTKVGYLTLPAEALEALAAIHDRFRAMVMRALSYVEMDPNALRAGGGGGKTGSGASVVSGRTSGRAGSCRP